MTHKPTGSELGKALWALSVERFATTARADFRFAPLNVFLLIALFALGLAVHLILNPFTAEAVKFSIERTTKIGKGAAFIWGDLKEVQVIDDFTVKINLKSPNCVTA